MAGSPPIPSLGGFGARRLTFSPSAAAIWFRTVVRRGPGEWSPGPDGSRQFADCAVRNSKFAVTTLVESSVTHCVALSRCGAHAVARYVPGGAFRMTYLPSGF